MEKILITGAKGFIGKNLVTRLRELDKYELFEYDIDKSEKELEEYVKHSDFIFHLAGINRPKNENEFIIGNVTFSETLLNLVKKENRNIPIIITSSIQAKNISPYGMSKKAAEDLFFTYKKKTGYDVFVYRLHNVFGKWCNPNYNSAVATFCYNISHDLDVSISDRNYELSLVYIDDIIDDFIQLLAENRKSEFKHYSISKIYKITLGDLVEKLYQFKDIHKSSIIPDLNDSFNKKLYSTFLSYYDKKNIAYNVNLKTDNRGWLFELLKSKHFGQIFISTTEPGITRGNHYHHTKFEKFCVIQGKAAIAFRHINSNEKFEINVSDRKIEIVDIPPGYTHNIKNIGETKLITVFWANEIFDINKPDTYYEKV